MVKKNSKKPQPKKKNTAPVKGSSSTVARAFLIFMISACMFTLGVFVGRGTAPVRFDIEKLEKELAELKKAMIQRERKQAKIYRQTIGKEAELGFYEALKTPGSNSGEEDSLGMSTPKPLPAEKPSERPKTQEKRLTHPDASVEKLNVGHPGHLTIQVASVKDVKAAEAMVARLKRKGYPARRVLGKVPGKGIWYRVRIGFFKTKAAAVATLNRLKKDKYNGIVIRQ